ncbi:MULTISPECIES: twin-arginine translocase TatA/TatE family subunit [unclassified Thermoplasma]|uniref:twin-arginine translocase TatA/TatE family subunit n=1 Tax=unclassified Thermoplasma TaxID=2684908 RepID=UPI000D93C91E|nr:MULTISPECIES: twin-arginine translocase TatA/TatE family subunit [unclassified Thermoplasma]PYB67681.1 twin-arginine translocase TatA/TatE family subunit [Thermoplasma sp. Kam2015]
MLDSAIEWLIVIVAILVLFGSAKKVPELAKNIGRATGEFKRGQMEVEEEIRKAMYSKTPSAQSNPANGVDYIAVAKTMGIDTEGKSTEELKAEIQEKLQHAQ